MMLIRLSLGVSKSLASESPETMPSMVAQKTHILSTQIPIANTTPDQNQINKYVFYSQFLVNTTTKLFIIHL